MTGWLINEIPVVAHSYRSIFEYAMRSVVDEVFLYIPMDDEFPIAMTVQNLEDMGIKTNLNISQFQIHDRCVLLSMVVAFSQSHLPIIYPTKTKKSIIFSKIM